MPTRGSSVSIFILTGGAARPLASLSVTLLSAVSELMDANRCVHVGLSLYLLTFIGDLR